MNGRHVFARAGRRLAITPWVAITIAAAMLVASLLIALDSERTARATVLREATVQADLLAESVAAPLAFSDRVDAQLYVDALRANPRLLAAGAYDGDGNRLAGFARAGSRLPDRVSETGPVLRGTDLFVSTPVMAGGARLGTVYLHSRTESSWQRASRYVGIGLVLVMASLIVAVLGSSHASLNRANAALEAEMQSRAEAEAALLQSQKMEAMGQLTGGVAHDFNNLLTPIIGSLDMLQRRRVGTEREQRLIDGALQSAERAKTLVQRLLAFARRQPLQPQPVDLGPLLMGMSDLLISTCGPQVTLAIDVSADLPPVQADPHQLEMAILNLSVNARDAASDNGTLTISARPARIGEAVRAGLPEGDHVLLSVRDTGAGMDAATLSRAIEPFFSTKGVGKGTGLGLSMVHGLMSQLKGGMIIESSPGSGTDVQLLLPVSPGTPTSEEAPRHARVPQAFRGTALLVDDEDLVRAATSDMLGELGYKVIEARSAEEAVARLESGAAFDIVVTDHLMPGMSGAELAIRLRESRPGLPVIIVSGYAEAEGIAHDLPRLTKPFRAGDLSAAIAALPPG